MSGKTIRLNDIGTSLVVRFLNGGSPLDIVNGTQFSIILTSPAGIKKTMVATALVPSTDGKISYDTQVGDIDAIGLWEIMGTMTSAAGFWTSTNDYFLVEN